MTNPAPSPAESTAYSLRGPPLKKRLKKPPPPAPTLKIAATISGSNPMAMCRLDQARLGQAADEPPANAIAAKKTPSSPHVANHAPRRVRQATSRHGQHVAPAVRPGQQSPKTPTQPPVVFPARIWRPMIGCQPAIAPHQALKAAGGTMPQATT